MQLINLYERFPIEDLWLRKYHPRIIQIARICYRDSRDFCVYRTSRGRWFALSTSSV